MSPPSKPQPTQKDIARILGLSQASVSKALKNDPEIEESTRQKVHEAARKLHYQPNPMAAGLAHFRATSKVKPVHATLAWLNVWPDPQRLRHFPEFNHYWKGACAAAQKRGYQLEEFCVSTELIPHRLQKILLTREIRGILIPPIPNSARVNWSCFGWGEFCAVRLGRHPRGLPQLNVVTSAQSYNAALALEEMRERGYERIGYLGYRTNNWTYLGGFIQAQLTTLPEAVRIPPLLIEETVDEATWEDLHAEKVLFDQFCLWIQNWKPDAILTELPATARLLKKAGMSIPKDIAVAALNLGNVPFDTGIYQNPEEIGRVATLSVISVLEDNDFGIPSLPSEILIKGTWVDGSSLPAC